MEAKATPTVSEADASAADEARLLRARIDLMVSTMSGSVWINPFLAFLWVLPFLGLFPILGTIGLPQFVAIMAIQIANSVGARTIHLDYKQNPADSKRWLIILAAYQAAVGASWGLFVWMIWADGNSLNNILVTMTVAGIIWAYAVSRVMHSGVYLAGVLPTMVLTIARIIKSGGPVALPMVVITVITFVLVSVFAAGGRRLVEVMLRTQFANEDLTADLRKTRDEALRKRFEAEAANASKTTFLANMSHELRTPLNAILGFSDLIVNETLGPVGNRRYREYAGDINASGTHLLSIINDILDIAKIESGKMEIAPQTIDPRIALEAAANVVLGRVSEKNQTLKLDIALDVGSIYAEERAFKQIALNLLSNAVKFTPEGGRIEVALRGTRDGGCELCVKDNGPGIPAAVLDQVFLPFNQIDNRYNRHAGGTGLGLSLVKGLTELHGGRAWIESSEGAGVKAHVYFPPAPATCASPVALKISS